MPSKTKVEWKRVFHKVLGDRELKYHEGRTDLDYYFRAIKRGGFIRSKFYILQIYDLKYKADDCAPILSLKFYKFGDVKDFAENLLNGGAKIRSANLLK